MAYKINKLNNQEIETKHKMKANTSPALALEMIKSDQYLAEIIDHLPDPTFVINLEGKVIAWNKAITQLTGVKAADILGKGNYEYALPFYGERRPVLIDFAIKKDLNIEGKYDFINREDGTLIVEVFLPKLKPGGAYLWAKATPLYDSQDNIVGSIETIRDITDRKLSENNLRESESLKLSILNACPHAVFVLGNRKIIFANKAAERVFGYRIEELVGQNTRILYRSDQEYEKIGKDFYPKLEKQPVFAEEFYCRAKDGKDVLCMITASVTGEKLAEKRIVAIYEDITTRKKAEQELFKTKEQLDFLLISTPAVIYSCDITDNYPATYVSENITKVLGYTQEEFLSSPDFWINHIHPEDKKMVLDGLGSGIKKGRYDYDYRFLHKNGNYLWMLDELVVINDNNGNPVKVVGYIIDITARRQAEANLMEKDAKYRILFEESRDAIYMRSREGKFLTVNNSMLNLFGYSEAEMIGMDVINIYANSANFQQFKKAIEEKGYVRDYELKLRKKDGRIIDVLISSTVWRDDKDNILGYQGIVRDVTGHKRDQEKIEKLNEDLVKINKQLKKLALCDVQTGLYNYRYLQEIIEAEFYRARRYGHPISAIMMDIDYFKSINDVYGHQFGDLVLKQLAQQLKKMVRKYDIVIRLGGEEFVILSPGADRSVGLTLARRLLDAINLYNFGNQQHIVKLKLSIAVSSYPEDRIGSGMDLINSADNILNKVKESGGNSVYSFLDLKREKVSSIEKNTQGENIQLLEEKIEKLTRRSNQSLIEAVFAFAKTIELKDHYTGEHVERTVSYATGVANALGLSHEEVERIRQAAILHDLGKIGISEKILLKPSELTRKEFDEIKRHPQVAVEVIRPIQFLHSVIPLILYHHERWDGKGYPNGLKAEEIPLGARIIAVADVYQALISNRPYRKKAYTKDEAIKIIKVASGSQFDPSIVDVFSKIAKKFK